MVLKGKTLVKQEPLSLKKSQYRSWDLKSSSFKIFNGLVADVKHYSCASMCKKSEHGRKEVDEIHEFKLCRLQWMIVNVYCLYVILVGNLGISRCLLCLSSRCFTFQVCRRRGTSQSIQSWICSSPKTEAVPHPPNLEEGQDCYSKQHLKLLQELALCLITCKEAFE